MNRKNMDYNAVLNEDGEQPRTIKNINMDYNITRAE